MLKDLIKHLKGAEGRSELVIVVFCDIRGFTGFSANRESPDIAMFIKRFYTKLLEKYFQTANFAKPTGDGLLLVFKYTEQDVHEVASRVLRACFKVIKDFPTMFKGDPMINFPTPANLGFGIARGTGCCLFSGKQVLDYSGQILNLAARLKDIAHPRGIIIDGAFQANVIPESIRASFKPKQAYIRSIAEESPYTVLCSEDIKLPYSAQAPLMKYEWKLAKLLVTVEDLKKLGDTGTYSINLPQEVLTKELTKLQMSFKNPNVPGYTRQMTITNYNITTDASGQQVRFPVSQAQSIVVNEKLGDKEQVTIEFHFVPMPKAKKKRGK